MEKELKSYIKRLVRKSVLQFIALFLAELFRRKIKKMRRKDKGEV